jgi:peptidoglycan/LPS O-acetylase OafA/YrhL
MNRSTSLYLDLFRLTAALVVMLSHVSFRGLTGGQLGAFAGAGVQAVDAFFVLSGFVIAYVCTVKENDVRSYFVSRAARIYSVALPAILLTAVLDAIGLTADPSVYSGPYQAFTPGLLVRSVTFLGEQWNAHRFPGTDGPYWSLGFEVWYYAAFGAYVFVPGRARWLAAFAVLAFIGPKVAVMFPPWLMGVGCYKFCRVQRLPNRAGWLLWGISFLLLAGYQLIPHSTLQPFMPFSLTPARLLSTAQDYFLAGVFSMNIIGFVVISDSLAPWLKRYARAIRWLAGSTFAIYLAHLPIMHCLAALSPWPKSSPWTLALLLTATPAACVAFAQISERRKHVWREVIAAFIGSPASITD